jgi:hypothetical protein
MDAAISQTALEGQNALAVIGIRVVATSEHDDFSSSFCIEGDVWFLRSPDAVEQNCQFACHGNDSFIFSLLTASSSPTVGGRSPYRAGEGYDWHTQSAGFGDRRCGLL